MTNSPHGIDPVPAATLRVARAAFPKGALAIRLRDAPSALDDATATAGQPIADQPTEAPCNASRA